MSEYVKYRFTIVNIEAWKISDGLWDWNDAWKVGEAIISDDKITPRRVFRLLREDGFLSQASKGRVTMEDDGYAITIMSKNTREPLFALIYEDEV